MTVWLPSWRRVLDTLFNFLVPETNNVSHLQGKSLAYLSVVSSALCSTLVLSLAASTLLTLFPSTAYANNLAISNVEIKSEDNTANTVIIEFDISWSNAWSDSINHDAAWVFVKYSTVGTVPYSHATLKTAGTNPSGFSGGSFSTGVFNAIDFVVPTDKMGVFIKPAHQGAGTLSFTDVQVVWDYGADGIADDVVSNGTAQVQVSGIEMTYIADGGFTAGDQVSPPTAYGANGQFELAGPGGETNQAPTVNSEGRIRFASASNDAWYYNTDSGANDEAKGQNFDVSESFPKGFQAFYLMKYEITQGQYKDFLNTLSTTQDALLFPSQDGNSRHEMAGTAGSRTAIRPDRAMNFMTWPYLCALADWSALRPITELEFEKAARGPLTPTLNEYAWGTTTKTACTSLDLGGAETGAEVCNTGSGNINFGSNNITGGDTPAANGPIRAGLFATSSSDTRAKAGAGYYGNMELSGNVSEQVVTLGTPEGRGFSGTHGDGEINTAGYATNDDWPGFTAGTGVNGAVGTGERGGSFADTTDALVTISNRTNAADEVSAETDDRGGRLARTANS
ncbi:MAG: SUMF1/EgtB/PvdO family nonheme iron enzyme [Candidatus Omnitrophota bacterium]|nr:SUMF1/EgtB/PvdO family nonheme iron enzyme [Candidatus Omnitrophota bacterium]